MEGMSGEKKKTKPDEANVTLNQDKEERDVGG